MMKLKISKELEVQGRELLNEKVELGGELENCRTHCQRVQIEIADYESRDGNGSQGEEEYRKMESEEKEKSVRLSKEIEVWEEES